MDLNVYRFDCLGFCATIGVKLYPWQVKQIKALTAFGADGHPLYHVAGVSVPRGNGKTFLAAAILSNPPPKSTFCLGSNRKVAEGTSWASFLMLVFCKTLA